MREEFVPPATNFAEKAGYILFKDSKAVIFYSNDLGLTPSKPILHSHEDEAISAVRGIGNMQRWTGSENLVRTDFGTPNLIISCNMFMNGVDRFDQLKAVNFFIRK